MLDAVDYASYQPEIKKQLNTTLSDLRAKQGVLEELADEKGTVEQTLAVKGADFRARVDRHVKRGDEAAKEWEKRRPDFASAVQDAKNAMCDTKAAATKQK